MSIEEAAVAWLDCRSKVLRAFELGETEVFKKYDLGEAETNLTKAIRAVHPEAGYGH